MSAWRRWAASWKARRRAARAIRGEKRAVKLLKRHGFDVVDTQAHRAWTIEVDGAPLTVDLRADLIVERDGARYVAEVKTGTDAPRITNRDTRRQLLEYRVAYDVEGVLLVDMQEKRVVEVTFPL